MNKTTFKFLLSLVFTFFSLVITAQDTAIDEDTGSYTTCNPEGANDTRTSADLPNAVNVGTIDDRSCYANYKEVTIDDTVWGIYNITTGSNNQDTNTLQPRIERSLSRSKTRGVGSYARFTGTVRILEAAYSPSNGRHGSYIMQAKGKHSEGGGSPDPAICLYRAEPVFGTNANGDRVQVSFNIVREQISFRGGAGAGRQIIFLTNIKKNEATDIELEVGFRADPNDPTKKIHYSDAIIGGKVFNWNIPEPERALESGIRYGAYRVHGGRAQIRWANTTYEKKEIVDNANQSDDLGLKDKVFSLKNVATGTFLTDSGKSATPVTMSNLAEATNTHWSFVQSGEYYNIDSETFGILRAPGSGFDGGNKPYFIVSTNKAAPAADTDKTWTIYYNETDDTYRFESRTSGRYLYYNEDGTVTHAIATANDDRSNWQLILVDNALSISDTEFNTSSIKVYPNPAKDDFTISLNNIEQAEVIIYNTLGKTVYQGASVNGNLKITNNRQFVSGLYMVKAITSDNKVYHSKLVVR